MSAERKRKAIPPWQTTHWTVRVEIRKSSPAIGTSRGVIAKWKKLRTFCRGGVIPPVAHFQGHAGGITPPLRATASPTPLCLGVGKERSCSQSVKKGWIYPHGKTPVTLRVPPSFAKEGKVLVTQGKGSQNQTLFRKRGCRPQAVGVFFFFGQRAKDIILELIENEEKA